MTNIAQAISYLSYFFWRLRCSFFQKSPQLAASKMLVPLSSYATPGVPLLPRNRNKKKLHGCSLFQGRGGWISNLSQSYVLRTFHRRPGEEGGIIFHSFQLLEWVVGQSIPFIMAQCSHLLQEAASPAVVILLEEEEEEN